MDVDFGKMLFNLRKMMKVEEIAVEVQVSPGSVYHWSRGGSPTQFNAQKVEELYKKLTQE